MLDPRRLHLLVELADRGTISAVADALHFTPSTVSHGLSALEREVGVPLLERSPRSVRLTPAGGALGREGRAVLRRLGAAEAGARAVGQVPHLLGEPIRVCVAPGAARGPIPLSSLRDRPFAAGRRDSMCHRLTRVLCERAGFEPDIAFETDDVAFTSALVRAGAAVALMPALLLATAPEPVLGLPLDPPAEPRRIFAAHRASAGPLASVAAALRALRASTASIPSAQRSDGGHHHASEYLTA